MRTDRRDEFAAFLRTRRERLSPADVGLPAGTRRRVAGLRREEVATLAGVGLTWYTWLEQGRPIAASDQVLGAIARALRMTEDERDHLFALAGATPPERDEHACVSAAHLDLLSKLMPYPAAVQTARFDIRAYNRSYRFLFADLDAIAPEGRNCAVRIFTDPAWQHAHRPRQRPSSGSWRACAPPTGATTMSRAGSASSPSSRSSPHLSPSCGAAATWPPSTTR
jgi:transcriptional regulator with XRE-family HTH domain